jgi:hypothetical protein
MPAPEHAEMTDDQIIDLLAEGHDPVDVVSYMIEDDVGRGEYEGCSTEMELAYSEHLPRVQRLLEDAGG